MVAAGIPGATPFGGHAGPVYCVAFSPDGTAFASGGWDGVVRLWDTASATQLLQLAGHVGSVLAVAWSPDGSTIASGGNDHTVRLWDAATGQEVRQFTRHNHVVQAVAWRPDGTAIASGAYSVRVWDARSGQEIRQFTGHNHPVQAVAWHPDGVVLASGAGTVRLWNATTGEQTLHLGVGGRFAGGLAWHPGGAVLASGSGGVLTLWSVAGAGGGAALDNNRGRLIDRWDVTERRLNEFTEYGVRRPYGEIAVRAVAWNADGTAVAAGFGSTIGLWDLDSGSRHRPLRQLVGHTGEVRGMAWSRGGTAIATAADDRTVRLWDASTGQQTHQLARHTGEVTAVAWSPDGSTIATTGSDSIARLWDAATGQEILRLTEQAGDDQRAVAWNPEGTAIAACSTVVSDDRIPARGAVTVWDTGSGRLAWRSAVDTPSYCVAWSPNGTAVAAGDLDGNGWILDASSGAHISRLTGHDLAISGIAWSPDSATVATADLNGIRLWDAATGQEIRRLTRNSSTVWAIAWSPDGTTLADTSEGTIRFWNPETGRQTKQLTGHNGPSRAIAWTRDGTALASAGAYDGTVRIWDQATGQQVRQLTGHTSAVWGVAWSPEGNKVASVGEDGTIRIWNPRSGTQVNGTGFGVARPPARPLAGVRSDSASDADLLGVGDDVETLAELVAATETRPPLAIALIGDWGAGKSSVMLQMEKHVGVLSDRARNNPGLTAWAEAVRQVRFNAWHYSDDQLWAGLISRLFEVLAAPEDRQEDGEDEAGADPRSVAGKRAKELLARRKRAERDSDRLQADLRAVEAMSRPAGSLSWVVSPWYAARVLAGVLRQGVADLRASLVAVLSAVVVGAGAYAAWHYLHGWIAAVTTAVAVAVPPVTLALGRTRDFVERQRASLAARQQEYERDIKSLSDQIVLVDAAARLARFLDERGGGESYRKYQGLLGQVRDDLDQLSADLVKARRQWEHDGRVGPPPLERIVLYVDDLDRCPPRRVVEVLEAVHLMLALDLFVVVVAVDARWLVRSLEYHHRELFRGGDGQAPVARRDAATGYGHGDDGGFVTPIDYLDKIFQIPFTLLPPAPDAAGRYLRSLLPEPASGTRAAVPATPGKAGADGEGFSEGTLDGTARLGRLAEPGQAVSVDDAAEPGRHDVGSDEGYRPDGATADRAPREQERRADDSGTGQRDPGGRALLVGAGAGDAGAGTGTGVIELRPHGLEISQAEVEFMAGLGELLPTPRAAKRLVNIYRLVRIGIPRGKLDGFVGDEAGGPYQAVQVLLAILVGHPEFAREMFRLILGQADGEAGDGACGDLTAVATEALDRGGDTDSFRIIRAFLIQVRGRAPLSVDMGECRRWCPQLARFSFYTRDLTGSAGGYLDVAAGAGLADVDLGRDALA